MPKSSFFDTVTLPQGSVPGGIPQGAVPGGMPQGAVPGGMPGIGFPSRTPSRIDPKLRAYYQNIYGSKADVEWDPTTNRADASFRAPVGDHQNQFFLNAGGYYQPSGTGTPVDYGVRLGFEKRIAPQGLSGGQLINRVLAPEMGIQEGAIPASVRSGILSELSPNKLKELNQKVREAQREEKDRQLGIVPGAVKYKYGISFGGEESDPGSQQGSGSAVVDPRSFLQNFSGALGQ